MLRKWLALRKISCFFVALTFLNLRMNTGKVWRRVGWVKDAYEMHMGCNRFKGFFVASE